MGRTPQPPNYLKHRVGKKLYARTKLFGKEVPLGPWGSPESYEKLEEVRARWRALVAGETVKPDASSITVADLVAAWWRHVDEDGLYRRVDGSPTSEIAGWADTAAPLLRLFARLPVREFGPRQLKTLRTAMLTGTWLTAEEQEAREREGRKVCCCRKTVNQRVGRVQRLWGYGVSEDLVPTDVHHALLTVTPISAGTKNATDHPDREPAPDQDVKHTLPCLPAVFRAIALVQLATGMRPGEVCSMRKEEIDRHGLSVSGREIWVYRPGGGLRHKTARKGVRKAVALGPAAQWALRPFLDLEGPYVFPGRRGGHASVSGYSHAVLDAARTAGVPDWNPALLRKNAATEIEEHLDLDTARAALGHTTAGTTKRFYARGDLKKAAQAAAKLG